MKINWKPDCPSTAHHKDIEACMKEVERMREGIKGALRCVTVADFDKPAYAVVSEMVDNLQALLSPSNDAGDSAK